MKPQERQFNKIDGVCYGILALLALALILGLVVNREEMPEKVLDCVVHIRATDLDVDYYDYYENYQQSWQGSGCFISSDGIILTAGHVVDEAEEFVVTLRDGREFLAVKWMKGENTDVGFLKIDVNEPVPYLVFDWNGVKLLEEVFVAGHPYGTNHLWNITKGVVSCLERDCEGFFGVYDMIQVDAASYPGNSGGPVVDKHGNIVGVLVGGYGQNECISYITPTWIAKEWADVFREWLECYHD